MDNYDRMARPSQQDNRPYNSGYNYGRQFSDNQPSSPWGSAPQPGPRRPERQPQAAPRPEKDTLYFLGKLERRLKEARKLPLSEQYTVDRTELLILLKRARECLPDDLRRAQWLLEQNQNLLAETRKEAEKIMWEAEEETAKMIDQNEITMQAREQARQIINQAARESREMLLNTQNMARSLLQSMEEQLTEMLVFVRENKSHIGNARH